MNQNLIVVQQYLSWKGHYKQYFENLHDSKYQYLYASDKLENYKNAVWIKSDFDAEQPLTIKSKIKGRFFDSFNAFKYLSSAAFDVIHLIEFEPLTYLLFASRFKKTPRLLITIHSSSKLHFSNWINSKLSGFQRGLLNRALKKAIKTGAHIVTHYECHKESIIEVIGETYRERVTVINYPAPKPESDQIKTLKNPGSPHFLIYGQIREDKGIYEFLSGESTQKLNITIAGKIVDRKILEFSERKNLTIIDKFLSDKEISDLVDNHDYMLLPYPIEYTNGAGTFKDSLAKAMPVVCSRIPIFEEIIGKHNVGVTFNTVDEIEDLVKNITKDRYKTLSQNCLNYAFTYNWEYMRDSYFNIYEQLLH